LLLEQRSLIPLRFIRNGCSSMEKRRVIPVQQDGDRQIAVSIKTNMLEVFKIDSGLVYLFINGFTNTVPELKGERRKEKGESM